MINRVDELSSKWLSLNGFGDAIHARDTITILDSDFHETVVAPPGTPRVLDDPILLHLSLSADGAFLNHFLLAAVSDEEVASSDTVPATKSSKADSTFVLVEVGCLVDESSLFGAKTDDDNGMIKPYRTVISVRNDTSLVAVPARVSGCYSDCEGTVLQLLLKVLNIT